MPDYDAGFKIAAHVSGRQLAVLGGVDTDAWEPIRGEVHATERLADRAFRARRSGERFVVYMEAYTRWKTTASWSILAKSALLSEREHVPTVSLVYVLLPRSFRSQAGTLRLEVGASPTQQVWYQEACLWRQQPEPWWEDAPGLMTLYPLCRHNRPLPQALGYAAGVIAERVGDPGRRADLLTCLGLFGKLMDRGLDVVGIIGREQMKESAFYQEIVDEGRKDARRADILEALVLKFGPRAEEFSAALQAIDDPEQLTQLFQKALRCRRLADFRRALSQV